MAESPTYGASEDEADYMVRCGGVHAQLRAARGCARAAVDCSPLGARVTLDPPDAYAGLCAQDVPEAPAAAPSEPPASAPPAGASGPPKLTSSGSWFSRDAKHCAKCGLCAHSVCPLRR